MEPFTDVVKSLIESRLSATLVAQLLKSMKGAIEILNNTDGDEVAIPFLAELDASTQERRQANAITIDARGCTHVMDY